LIVDWNCRNKPKTKFQIRTNKHIYFPPSWFPGHTVSIKVMQIFLRNLEGLTVPVTLAQDATVADIESEHRLIFAGRQLESEDSILSLGLTEGSTVFETSELLGGGKKRKKKVYTKPKKIKHKNKKVKLAVLKYYKVDGDKITRLRKECPAPQCGAGVFMAMHSDRYYCGKCHMTYKMETDSK